MSTVQRMTMGTGAVVTCLARLLRPKRIVEAALPNANPRRRLACRVLRLEPSTSRDGRVINRWNRTMFIVLMANCSS
jgi:hypothetical protein